MVTIKCELCGDEYTTKNPITRYCKNCRKQAELIRQRNRRKTHWHCECCDKLVFSRRKHDFICDECRASINKSVKCDPTIVNYEKHNYKFHLDTTLAELKEQGISYAEFQKKKTLEQIPKIKI